MSNVLYFEKVRIHAISLGRNKKGDWERFSFAVTISYPGDPTRKIQTDYHMGIGLGKKHRTGHVYEPTPKAKEVIGSLFSDASCADGTFEDFCGNMGYDTDSRKALETYLACQESESKLRKFFGSHYNEAAEFYRDE